MLSVGGYNGRGIAPGTTFGRLLALYALGQLDEKDLPLPASTPIKPNFRSARTALYEVGAQFVHLIEARL